MGKVYKRETNCFPADIARLRGAPSLSAMKKLIQNLLRVLQDARQRRINERSLAELDVHTLRDIGFQNANERARIEASRYRLHFGLF